jgi:hypothetical protein
MAAVVSRLLPPIVIGGESAPPFGEKLPSSLVRLLNLASAAKRDPR